MTISKKLLGERLMMMRKHLGVLQTHIAKDIGVHQNVISRLESGTGGNLDNLLLVTNYFSEFFYMDKFFSEDFIVMELSNLSENELLESVAIERLELLKKQVEDEINVIAKLLKG